MSIERLLDEPFEAQGVLQVLKHIGGLLDYVALDLDMPLCLVGLNDALDLCEVVVHGGISLVHSGCTLEISCGFEDIEFQQELLESRETN